MYVAFARTTRRLGQLTITSMRVHRAFHMTFVERAAMQPSRRSCATPVERRQSASKELHMHAALQSKMAAGKPVLGLQLLVHHPTVVEIAGWCGADYVIVDGEHAAISPVGLEAIVRAAEIAGIVPVIRTFVNHGSDLLPYLDLGFRGVMVPHLKTAAQAIELVKFTRFPPSGERSITPGRVSRYFATPQTAQDLERLSNEILIIAQIEDAEAVENIESILDVDGIDIYNV